MSKVVIRLDALRTHFEAFWLVLIQRGEKPDDDRDWIVALCPRKIDAKMVQQALQQFRGEKT
jgi:hypothetical protein